MKLNGSKSVNNGGGGGGGGVCVCVCVVFKQTHASHSTVLQPENVIILLFIVIVVHHGHTPHLF
jgi:hypothetical protein